MLPDSAIPDPSTTGWPPAGVSTVRGRRRSWWFWSCPRPRFPAVGHARDVHDHRLVALGVCVRHARHGYRTGPSTGRDHDLHPAWRIVGRRRRRPREAQADRHRQARHGRQRGGEPRHPGVFRNRRPIHRQRHRRQHVDRQHVGRRIQVDPAARRAAVILDLERERRVGTASAWAAGSNVRFGILADRDKVARPSPPFRSTSASRPPAAS